MTRFLSVFICFLCLSHIKINAQINLTDSAFTNADDSLNQVLVSNTRNYLIKQGYKPLSCQKRESANHFRKKCEDGYYSNAHQIGETPYFFEATKQADIAANKVSTTNAKKYIHFSKTKLDSIDTNNDFIITSNELIAYGRLIIKK